MEQNTNKKNDFIIRQETEKDFNEIYSLIQTAFKTAKVKGGDEQDFAVGLRNSDKYIPELGLVAEKGNTLIGHILLTETYVTLPNGNKFNALLLAPISVLFEYRNKGVGSALIYESLRIARQLGYTAIFLCGDPNYYNRFGFKQNSLYGIVSRQNIPEQFTLVCELCPDALKGISGIVECC